MSDLAKEERTFGERLQSVPRQVLYLILILVISASVVASKFAGPALVLPNKPGNNAIEFYATVMNVPEGTTVAIQSDWTNSTRGESSGQLESLLRILMRRNVKFMVYSLADPQAPQVARDTIARINLERKNKGEREYKRWDDWISLGFFPNGEGTAKSIQSDIRKAFKGKQDTSPAGPRDVYQSPVLQNIDSLDDLALYVNITASKTIDVLIERLKFKPAKFGDFEVKNKLGSMCTGVMGPETTNYYSAGQLFGLVVGLNGVVEMETLMEKGVNWPEAKDTVEYAKDKSLVVPGWKGQQNYARGTSYYFALHTGMALLILAVAAGNIGMWLARRGRGEN